ncbi:MAG: aldo/keto reductase [Planctomycetes bacterium]|nr:aldo/keto reductase [Planctomycetota bacterium]
MQTRRFGRTELQMPVYSCGGMRYMYKWRDVPLGEVPPENQANLEATIRRSVELGINHIETARGYGSSERQLGLVLPTFPRDELIVQTKIAPTSDPAEFVAHFRESLQRLQLDYVDLLGLHGINTHELLWWSVRKNGCLAAARELQAEGLVRHIGFSTHGSTEVILDTIQQEAYGGFDYVNLHWYYINQKNWPGVEAAAAADMGVFIISPSDKGGMLYKPTEKLVELCQPYHPLVFNVLFCLQRPEVHTLSLGASCPDDFEMQVAALKELDSAGQHLETIEDRLYAAMVDAVGEDVAQHWSEGLPEWEAAPGYMNIPVILWLRNLLLAYDMQDYGKMRYNLLGNGEHWFPGQNSAHVEKLDLERSLKNSPFAEQIPGWLRETHEQLYEAPKKRLSQS